MKPVVCQEDLWEIICTTIGFIGEPKFDDKRYFNKNDNVRLLLRIGL